MHCVIIHLLFFHLHTHSAVDGVMAVPPGVAHMDVDPTPVGGEVGGALEVVDGVLVVVGGVLVVVGGALAKGEAVDPVHEPLQVHSTF